MRYYNAKSLMVSRVFLTYVSASVAVLPFSRCRGRIPLYDRAYRGSPPLDPTCYIRSAHRGCLTPTDRRECWRFIRGRRYEHKYHPARHGKIFTSRNYCIGNSICAFSLCLASTVNKHRPPLECFSIWLRICLPAGL